MGEWAVLNKLAMGVIGTVLGLLGTAFATVVYALLGKKSKDQSLTGN